MRPALQVVRRRLAQPDFLDGCADAMARLNASGLNFDIELEASNATDGIMFAAMLSRMRRTLRTRTPGATVSAATGTGPSSHTQNPFAAQVCAARALNATGQSYLCAKGDFKRAARGLWTVERGLRSAPKPILSR